MTNPWLAAVVAAAAVKAGAGPDPTAAYRDYTLGDSLASVVATSGERYAEPRTIHTRPRHLQTFEWRAPFGVAGDREGDPVRALIFSFVDDALYRIDVQYDRDRTQGLLAADLVESIASTYGPALPPMARHATPLVSSNGISDVAAQWRLPNATLTLLQGVGTPEFALVLRSTTLGALADGGARESTRLDAVEAPRRAADARRQSIEKAKTATSEARARNKPTFRP